MSDFETPKLYRANNAEDMKSLATLRRTRQNLVEIDTLADQLQELAEVEHPETLAKPAAPIVPAEQDGVWVYFPWRSTLVRVLAEADYVKLRSSRNQLLITSADQAKFAGLRVAVAGLNVGNPAAVCLALEGGASTMHFADFDKLSLSNLNRFRAGLTDLGVNKAILSSRQVYEINPYASIKLWDEGLKPGDEADFLKDIDVLVEEMDNLPLKLSIREAARQAGIPVVMVTGNGANVIIDIERYDQHPDLLVLHGDLPAGIPERVAAAHPGMSIEDKVLIARDFMGAENLTKELQESFLQIGKSLAGIPQLAESSFLRGAAVCYVLRQIATGQPAPSGRYNLKLDEVLK